MAPAFCCRDGLIELRVRTIRGKDVIATLSMAELWASIRASTFRAPRCRFPLITEKDRKDLEFGLKHGVDVVALSFVRSAADVAR